MACNGCGTLPPACRVEATVLMQDKQQTATAVASTEPVTQSTHCQLAQCPASTHCSYDVLATALQRTSDQVHFHILCAVHAGPVTTKLWAANSAMSSRARMAVYRPAWRAATDQVCFCSLGCSARQLPPASVMHIIAARSKRRLLHQSTSQLCGSCGL